MKFLFPPTIIVFIVVIIIFASTSTYLFSNLQLSQAQIAMQKQTISNQQQTIESQTQTIQNQKSQISSLNTQVQEQAREISELKTQITNLQYDINSLTIQLGQTQTELTETTRLLDVAQKYEDRVDRGVQLSQAYKLLGDYDKVQSEIIANVTNTGATTDDSEIWSRGKDVYDWLGIHYKYCSDKGFCISEQYCAQIQFFSPDELLYYGSQDVLCGDCDDKAQLFAGMLYASGVPHDRVRVECGLVGTSGHCWNGIYVNNTWYRVDPTCSSISSFVLEKFGLSFLIPDTYPSSTIRNVDCMSYEMTSWYNPEGYYKI